MAHNRTIGTVGCCILFMFIYEWTHNNKKRILADVLIILLCGSIFLLLKYRLFDGGTGSVDLGNSVQGQIARVQEFQKLSYWITVIGSALCKIWSIEIAYFSFPILGILLSIRKLVIENKDKDSKIFILFLIFNVFAELMIASVYMSSPSREDTIFYIRYFEYTIFPFLAYGIYYFLNEKLLRQNFCMALICLSLSSMAVLYFENHYDTTRYLAICIPAVAIYGMKEHINYFLANSLVIEQLFVLTYLYEKKIIRYGFCLLTLVLWVNTASISIKDFEDYSLSYEQISGYKNISKYIDDNKMNNVYFLWEGNTTSAYFQYYLYDKSVKIITVEDINNMHFNKEDILICRQDLINLLPYVAILYEEGNYYLLGKLK